MSSTLSIRDVYKSYGGVAAVRGVSLTVRPGQLLAVLGPSGCGKSTLLRIVAGLLRPERGCIEYGGVNITPLPPERRSMGYLFQSYALFPHMSVAENVGFGLAVRGHSKDKIRARVNEVLELVGMRDYADRRPNQLSGGQQQRVALARALAPGPSALLLDEPLSAIDLQIRKALRSSIRRLQKTLGVTTILVTHDQEEAFEMADGIAVMRDGRIEQYGSPEEVYLLPATEFVARFVGAVNIIEAVLTGDILSIPETSISLGLGGSGQARMSGPVKVVVRPEDVVLGSEARDESSARAGDGTITDAVFLGSAIRLEVKIGRDMRLTSLVLRDRAARDGLVVGARVPVSLRNARVLS